MYTMGVARSFLLWVPDSIVIASHTAGIHTHKHFTPQLVGNAHQLGCPKNVLDHVHVYLHETRI